MLEGTTTPSAHDEVTEALETSAESLAPLWDLADELKEGLNVVKRPYESGLMLLEDPAFDEALTPLAEVLSTRDKRAREAGYQALLADLHVEGFRTDAARQRGPGLGMVITAEIARQAGWTLRWQPLEPRGTRAEISGPLVAPPPAASP